LVNEPIPPDTGTGPRFCHPVGERVIVPHTVACAAPGALNPNWSAPLGRRVAGLPKIVGASTMLKDWAEVEDKPLLVTLAIRMV
jgi:hypothetical protein